MTEFQTCLHKNANLNEYIYNHILPYEIFLVSYGNIETI